MERQRASYAAQTAATIALALISLRPILLAYEVDGLARSLSVTASLAAITAAMQSMHAAILPPDLTSSADPFAGRPARRLSLIARSLAALSILASLAIRVHISQVTQTPALLWFSALAGIVLSAWTCLHLRASLIRARFFWALGLGVLLALFSSLERPEDLARTTRGLQRFEPGSSLNLALGVGTLLLAEGHPAAELFALAPLYAPASSALEPRTPWFRHLAALTSSLVAGLAVFAIRRAKAGLRAAALFGALFSACACILISFPLLGRPELFTAFDGAALWLLAGSAALFAPVQASGSSQ